MSGRGRIAEETRCAHGIAKSAVVEATAVRSQVESRVASLAVEAKASTAHAVSALSKCVKEVVVHTEEQTLRIIGTVAQQLEKEIEAAAVSTAAMSERHTHSAVDGLRDEVKVHIEQNCADF